MMRQVLVCDSSGADALLRIALPRTTVESTDRCTRTLRLGSQDIIRFSGYAVTHGFRVARFSLADSYLNPLEVSEELELSDSMIDILDEYGSDELESAMRRDFDGLYVIGVEVISESRGDRIVLRRRGFIDTSVVHDAEKLLNSAWKELRFT